MQPNVVPPANVPINPSVYNNVPNDPRYAMYYASGQPIGNPNGYIGSPPGYPQTYTPNYASNPYQPPPSSYPPINPYNTPYYQQPLPPQNNYDPETNNYTPFSNGPVKTYFDESTSITIRHAFIRKVYALLSLQLLISFSIILAFRFVPSLNDFMQQHRNFIIIPFVVFVVLMFVTMCFQSLLRKYPLNLIILFSISSLLGLIFSSSIIYINAQILLLAIGVTCVIFLALTLFAFQTKFDFTGYGVYFFIAGIAFFLISLIGIFIKSRVFHLVLAYLGVVMFSFYIVYDTQLIIGGQRKEQFSIDDYVIATLSLYLDIMNLFQYILQILNSSNLDFDG